MLQIPQTLPEMEVSAAAGLREISAFSDSCFPPPPRLRREFHL